MLRAVVFTLILAVHVLAAQQCDSDGCPFSEGVQTLHWGPDAFAQVHVRQ